MKVQKALIPDSKEMTWMVIDDNYMPIKPIQQYLAYLDDTGKSPNTIRSYAYHLKLYWEYLKDKSLEWNKVGIENLVYFLGWLQKSRCENAISIDRQKSKRSERTINTIISAVAMMYDYHWRLGSVGLLNLSRQQSAFHGKYKSFLHHVNKKKTINSKLLKLKSPNRLPRILTWEEVKILVDSCNRIRDKFLILLLYETGMRIGQALGLRHEDIHSWDNEIIITPRYNNENGARTKSDEANRIDVSQDLMKLYTDYLINEYGDIDSDYVFINLWGGETGKPLQYSAIIDQFRRLRKKTGIGITPHAFRHTHATDLLKSGWDMSYIQKRLGHKDIQTTINTYTHVTDDEHLKEEFRRYLRTRGGRGKS